LVLDFHHHNINSGNIKNDSHLLEIIKDKILPIWKIRDIKPKMHLSESRPGIKITDNITMRRAHADYITIIPDIIFELNNIGIELDLMIEAKMKEDAVLFLRTKFCINLNESPPLLLLNFF
jgi:UV DNA damage repair endonuclease